MKSTLPCCSSMLYSTCREVTEAIPVPLTSLQPLVRSARLTPGLQGIDFERVGVLQCCKQKPSPLRPF